MVWAYLTRKHAQKLVRKMDPGQDGPAPRWEKVVRKRVILYGLTSERRMRSKHPTLLEALELNLSLTVDSMRARLCGSAGIGNA